MREDQLAFCSQTVTKCLNYFFGIICGWKIIIVAYLQSFTWYLLCLKILFGVKYDALRVMNILLLVRDLKNVEAQTTDYYIWQIYSVTFTEGHRREVILRRHLIVSTDSNQFLLESLNNLFRRQFPQVFLSITFDIWLFPGVSREWAQNRNFYENLRCFNFRYQKKVLEQQTVA